MGQEQSSVVDESVRPLTLTDRTVESVAKLIRSGKAKKIVVMVGAGISTSAGIPDFRSPDTGLYANLARLDLPHAEAVFDISFFRSNPVPFYTLAHELYPGKYRPTLSHSFIRLLAKKGLLLKLFTQNIDCLDREAGVPEEKIVEAHGSFATQSCIECRTPFPQDLMKEAIDGQDVPLCRVPQCNGLVKPDIVFFGEQLPENFHRNRSLPETADLCIVMGTSLTVQPFASLPLFCAEGVPRVLINLERVGGLGSRPDDVLLLGDCDAGVRKLADALGWSEELDALWALTEPDATSDKANQPSSAEPKSSGIEEMVANLTEEVDRSLKISSEHNHAVRSQLSKESKVAADSPTLSQETQKVHITNKDKNGERGPSINTLNDEEAKKSVVSTSDNERDVKIDGVEDIGNEPPKLPT